MTTARTKLLHDEDANITFTKVEERKPYKSIFADGNAEKMAKEREARRARSVSAREKRDEAARKEDAEMSKCCGIRFM